MRERTHDLILQIIKADPAVTIPQMEALSGIDEGELWNTIRQMKAAGEIDHRGVGHTKRWYIDR